jgi:DNA primase
MAEAGSFADKVKSQADIVRVVGEYVRLKKSGQNFTGLCPFHSEKTPSFAVHPVRQIYHCFGCGVGGDVFSFVMAMEKCEFPEAVRLVAEKCGIPIPRRSPRSPEEAKENRQRAGILDMHRLAAAFFQRQLNETPEGNVARAYLEDRGLDDKTLRAFALGYAPSSGDALLRQFRGKFPDALFDVCGLFSRDQSGRLFDRFRRRIMFPIASESGKIIAFGGRALGDDLPKYLNSPETPIYSKSNVLYHFHAAKETMRKLEYGVLVEGYMDVIGVARAGIANVVASCGTSLTEPQVKLFSRSARRCVVNFDPDSAGQAATERSLMILLEQGFDVRILALPAGLDPDKFIREKGAESYRKLLEKAPLYLDYLIERARKMDLSSGEGKLRALNFLMPYVQRVPNRLLRSEWATRISAELRIEEPVLREALRKAAAERKDKVQPKAELYSGGPTFAERRLIRMLAESAELRAPLAAAIVAHEGGLHAGLETEKIFAALLAAAVSDSPPDVSTLAQSLPEKDSRLLYDILFEPPVDASWDEAETCLASLRRRRIESQLASVQRQIESNPATDELRTLLSRKQELRRLLAEM